MLLSMLYGKQVHYEISIRFADYQKNLLKIIKTIEKSVNENISVTDQYHKRMLVARLESIKTIIKSPPNRKDIFEQSLVAQLIEIILILIGELPNNIRRSIDGEKELTNAHNWVLTRHRNVFYTQDYTQKKNLIFDYYSLAANSNLEIKKSYLIEKYADCKYSDRLFISRFKKEHPSEYISIF